jgi:tetratricopeptide (TPR) repeat protein
VATVSESLAVAVKHHQAGELQSAERIYRQVLQTDPSHADALHLLGVLAHQMGKHELAVEHMRRAIASNPHAAAFHSNLGSAYSALRRLDEAVSSYRRALQIQPRFAEAHNNLGNALRSQGRLDEAVASFRRALQIKPDYTEAHNNLGNAFRELGMLDEAVGSFQRALHVKPDYAEACNNLGNALRELDRPDEAEAAYRRALHIRPDYADALGNLAGLYERLNRLKEAAATAAQGLQVSPDHPLLNLALAKCQEREGRHQEAIARLVKVRPLMKPDSDVAQELSFELARLFDRTGETSRAFAHFAEANRLASCRAPGCRELKRAYCESVDALARAFDKSWVDSWSPAPSWDSSNTPVFLIGFARSGTTLLEMILGSHPRIQTLGEKPTVLAMHREIEGFPGGFLRGLASLSPAQFARLRTCYFRTADEFIERRPGHVLIDRNPMNTVNVGLILRVFPAARFIVAVRHPCDVCLSCFMQDFKLNPGTAHFYALEDTASLYAKVMGLWQQYLRVLPHPYHVVRYEDLVDDFPAETRRVLQFLGVDWDDGLFDHVGHARRLGIISTPSYRQVTEPIYKRARYRWQRYAEHLTPIAPVLKPYIEYFGYQGSSAGVRA